MTHAKMTRDSFHVFQANARNALKQSQQVPSVLICAGTGCIAGGAMKIYENIRSECEKRGLAVYVGLKHDSDVEKSLHVKMSGCHGFCEMGPLVHIEPMGVMYIHVKPEDCHEILEKTVLAGRSSTAWCTTWTAWPIPGRRTSPSTRSSTGWCWRTAAAATPRTLRSISPRAATPALRRLCLR